MELSMSLEACGRWREALKVMEGVDEADVDAEARVSRARAMYACGRRQEAAAVVMEVLRACEEAESRPRDALLEYVRIALETSAPMSPARGDACALLVDLAAREPMGKRMPASLRDVHRALLARAVAEPGGMAAVVSAAGGDAAEPSALAFLGTVVREGGETDAAAALLEMAAARRPQSASIALNCAHAHELHGDPDKAVCAARRPFVELQARGGGMLISAALDAAVLGCTHAMPTATPIVSEDDRHGAMSWRGVDTDFGVDRCQAVIAAAKDAASSGGGNGGGGGVGDASAAMNESAPCPDALAVAFTLVKIFYVYGALERASCLALALSTHASCVRSALVKDTANEAAFFTCIASLLERDDAPRPQLVRHAADAARPWLFVAGDRYEHAGAVVYA